MTTPPPFTRALPPTTPTTPSPGTQKPRYHLRSRKRQKPLAQRIPQSAAPTPIVWPVELSRNNNGERQKIQIDPDCAAGLPRFFTLPLDIRRHIYGIMLEDAGKDQHIFCPSVARRGVPNQLHLQYLQHMRCSGSETRSCGHHDCERASAASKDSPSTDRSLGDFVSLMTTCKFGYQEVAHFLYSQTRFHFASFRELGAFLDWINPEAALCIRQVTFVAHIHPDDNEHCQELINGNFFRTPDSIEDGEGDHVALFRRMTNLQTLNINFYPSAMLAFSTTLSAMMEPLEGLAQDISATVNVDIPRMYYRKGKKGNGLPFVGDLEKKKKTYILTRSTVQVEGSAAIGCQAYRRF
ncbi:uncharacterized protein C8A04DRAFT_14019 [Dichotomopilus funicola]|uniref:DUF7730 domain-containing protein n=1 Tax=Dichotomopilus funicola TaxID=1934379 RepID=A0AAN6V0Z3_9PEZI|nr:hypothetical protein C8A04DRAFT_14019 [Dichotomopilus funicola]